MGGVPACRKGNRRKPGITTLVEKMSLNREEKKRKGKRLKKRRQTVKGGNIGRWNALGLARGNRKKMLEKISVL